MGALPGVRRSGFKGNNIIRREKIFFYLLNIPRSRNPRKKIRKNPPVSIVGYVHDIRRQPFIMTQTADRRNQVNRKIYWLEEGVNHFAMAIFILPYRVADPG